MSVLRGITVAIILLLLGFWLFWLWATTLFFGGIHLSGVVEGTFEPAYFTYLYGGPLLIAALVWLAGHLAKRDPNA
jgi:hypothetical protein